MNLCQSFGSSEDGVGEVGFSEGDVAEVGSSEVKSYFFVLSSPNVPGVNSLSEQIRLLLVCHRASLLGGAHIIEGHALNCKNTSSFLSQGELNMLSLLEGALLCNALMSLYGSHCSPGGRTVAFVHAEAASFAVVQLVDTYHLQYIW